MGGRGTLSGFVSAAKARFETLRDKYGSAENAMLLGSMQDAQDYVTLQKQVYVDATKKNDFKTAYETQPVTETTLNGWNATPTKDQRDALATYAANGYKAMNDYLRNGGSLQGVNPSEVNELQSFLSSSRTKETLYLKRGISKRSLTAMLGAGWENNLKALTGRQMVDKGFMSTSPFSSGSYGKNAVLYIKAPKGTAGAYIKDFVGSKIKTEQEFLLARNTKMTVSRAYTTKNKYGDTIPIIEVTIT